MSTRHVPTGDLYRLEVGGLLYEVEDDGRGTVYRIAGDGSRRRVRSSVQRRMVVDAMAEQIDTPLWRRALRWLMRR